jgi:hypothetical protein
MMETSVVIYTRWRRSAGAPWENLSTGGDLAYHRRVADDHKKRFPTCDVEVISRLITTMDTVVHRNGKVVEQGT